MIDPNDIDFTRAFSWPLLMDSTSLVYWYYCVGLQVAKAILHRRRLKERARGSLASIETPDMIAMCNADEQLRKEFHEFAASRYVVESVNFLQDVASFKQYFREKALSWRLSKIRILVDTYIKFEVSQEVNISAATRLEILKKVASLDKSNEALEFLTLFDHSYDDVNQMITNDVWIEFWLKRARYYNPRPFSPELSNSARLSPSLDAPLKSLLVSLRGSEREDSSIRQSSNASLVPFLAHTRSIFQLLTPHQRVFLFGIH